MSAKRRWFYFFLAIISILIIFYISSKTIKVRKQKYVKRNGTLCGLKNETGICYINSTIQCLMSIQVLNQLLDRNDNFNDPFINGLQKLRNQMIANNEFDPLSIYCRMFSYSSKIDLEQKGGDPEDVCNVLASAIRGFNGTGIDQYFLEDAFLFNFNVMRKYGRFTIEDSKIEIYKFPNHLSGTKLMGTSIDSKNNHNEENKYSKTIAPHDDQIVSVRRIFGFRKLRKKEKNEQNLEQNIEHFTPNQNNQVDANSLSGRKYKKCGNAKMQLGETQCIQQEMMTSTTNSKYFTEPAAKLNDPKFHSIKQSNMKLLKQHFKEFTKYNLIDFENLHNENFFLDSFEEKISEICSWPILFCHSAKITENMIERDFFSNKMIDDSKNYKFERNIKELNALRNFGNVLPHILVLSYSLLYNFESIAEYDEKGILKFPLSFNLRNQKYALNSFVIAEIHGRRQTITSSGNIQYVYKGHAYAVCSRTDSSGTKWYVMNDEEITEITEDQIHDYIPFILFYTKC